MPFTYILYSERKKRHYIGSCKNLKKRIDRHNAAVNPSTKYGVPWRLIWYEELETLSKARKLEIKIKKRGAKRFIEDLNAK